MQKKTILLVDDEPIILKSISKELTAEGYEVTTSNSGEEAVVLIGNNNFCLVISDMMMEGLDGMAVLKHAKDMNPDLPVIILTGFADLRSAITALRLGADDYLLKPCGIDELLFRINGCLEKYELRKKNRMYEKILPVCSVCKKIRDDTNTEHGKGNWMTIERYLMQKGDVQLSHGYCQSCYEEAIKNFK
jgi:DNA-binding NtrC family response regulator